MLDYQRLVEEIQAALLSQAAVDWDLLRDTAAEYAAACDEVNQRLAQCDRLLRQGLRSEGIQAAEREPSVLDAVAILDFPELPQWQQLLTTQGMVLPPPLRIDIASEINSAYAAEAPLQQLLKRHRLLALARAPLPDRIRVLRDIHLQDVMNPVWLDDLRSLETARHQELQKECEAAIRNRDLLWAIRLVAELEDQSWLYHPPPQIVEQARQRQRNLAASLAAEEMQSIEQNLSSAYSALDVVTARAARERWDSCQLIANLRSDHPLMNRAAPALAWLAEQDGRDERAQTFAETVTYLADALESDAPRPNLDRLYHSALRYEQEIPPGLVRRYQERIRAYETTAQRRFVVLTTAVVGVLLLVATCIGWAIHHRQREAAVRQVSLGLDRLVDEKNLSEAQQYYEEIQRRDLGISGRPEVQQEVGRLNALLTAEKERRSSFEALLSRSMAAGVETSDRSSLVDARKLAVTVDEKSRIADWQSKLDARDRQRQRERDERFEKEFKKQLAKVEELEQKIQAVVSIDSVDVNQLLAQIDSLQEGSRGVTPELSSQVKPLRLRVVTLNRQLTDAQRQQASLSRLAMAVGRPDAYQAALEAFVKEHAGSPLAGEFQRVLEEAEWWKGLHRWRELLSDWRFTDLGKISPQDAKDLLGRAEPLLAKDASLPLAEQFKSRQRFLQGVANRLDQEGKSRADALETIFEDKLVSKLWMIRMKSTDSRYYLLSEPRAENVASGFALVRMVTDFDLTEKNQSLREVDIEYTGLSPQSRLVADIRRLSLFSKIREGEWERGFYELIRVIDEHKETDPLLRLILLRRVIETAKQGSNSLQVSLSGLWTKLENASVDLTANWLLPDDESAKRSRIRASTALTAFESLPEFGRQAAELLRKDTAPLPPLPTWIGWLRPAGADSWTCEPTSSLPTIGELFVLGRTNNAAGESQPTWLRIGSCQANGVQWEITPEGALIAGRPVFHVPGVTGGAAPGIAGSK